MRAILLAAGKGTRLQRLTTTIPKPMLHVAGRPILEHNIRLLARHGIRELVINLHYYPVKVMDYFGDGSRFGVSILYSYEAELLGTAGAVKRVDDMLTEPFLVLYADNLTTCDVTRLMKCHLEKKGMGTVAVFERPDVESSGVVTIGEDDRIEAFVEKPDAATMPRPSTSSSKSWVNAGVYVLEPSVLRFIPRDRYCDFGHDAFPAMLAAKERLVAYRMTEGLWWIDTPSDYARIQSLAAAGEIVLP